MLLKIGLVCEKPKMAEAVAKILSNDVRLQSLKSGEIYVSLNSNFHP